MARIKSGFQATQHTSSPSLRSGGVYSRPKRSGSWKSSWMVAHWCARCRASRMVMSIYQVRIVQSKVVCAWGLGRSKTLGP